MNAWSSMVIAIAAFAVTCGAQPYPSRSIRIIVSGPPAGGPDIIGRMVGQKLNEAWMQPVVIENRPGGGGNIGAELAARANPDGYTLLVATPAHTANPTLYAKVAYDPVKDFAPVIQLTAGSYILVTPLSLPAKTLKDVIALAHTGKGIKYASAGIGAPAHLGMELLKTVASFDVLHVPYKGTAAAMVDVAAGQIDVFLATMPGGLPFIRSAKVKPLAVTGDKRSAALPNTPTVAESGVPGFETVTWFGISAPAATPAAVINKLHDGIIKVLRDPDLVQRMAGQGSEPHATTPTEMARYMREESARWKKVIASARIVAD